MIVFCLDSALNARSHVRSRESTGRIQVLSKRLRHGAFIERPVSSESPCENRRVADNSAEELDEDSFLERAEPPVEAGDVSSEISPVRCHQLA